MKLKFVESIFEKSTGFDSKNITNKSDKHVPQHMLDSIERGVTSEDLDAMVQAGLKIFKYRTQITVHGLFDDLTNNRIYGYSNLFQNKNKSIGIRYNAIDEEKRRRIAKHIRHAGFRYNRSSTEIEFRVMRSVDKTNYETVLDEMKSMKDKVDQSLFTGGVYLYLAQGMGINYLVLDVHVAIIPEANVSKFCENIIPSEEVQKILDEEAAEERERHEQYERERAESIAKRESVLSTSEISTLDGKYELVEKTNEPGVYVRTSFNYKDELRYVVTYVYLPKGKKKPRWNKHEFETLGEAMSHEVSESWSDNVFGGYIKNAYKIS